MNDKGEESSQNTVNDEQREQRQLPERIRQKLELVQKELDQIADYVASKMAVILPTKTVQFHFESSAPSRYPLPPEGMAQAISFITRYDHLPKDYRVEIAEHPQHKGVYYIHNFPFLRHVLNDFRSFIMNKKDSIHYQNIHRLCLTMLERQDATKGTILRVLGDNDQDVTAEYIKWLGRNSRAITAMVDPLDFDYLYNGILQHCGQEFSERFLKDFTSGELNYILWKHVHVLQAIHDLLSPYYKILSAFVFPKLGPL